MDDSLDQGDLPVSNDDLLESTTTLVSSVFRQVWQEFYDWKEGYCHDALNSLASDLGECLTNQRVAESSRASRNQHLLEVKAKMEKCLQDDLEVTTEEVVAPEIRPYSTYEACAFIQNNIWKGNDSPRMPFIPYADEPGFDYMEHSAKYDAFAWQAESRDPDGKHFSIVTPLRGPQ